MTTLLAILWLVTTVCFFVALIRPTLFSRITHKDYSRKRLLTFFLILGTIFLIGVGVTAPPVPAKSIPITSKASQNKQSETKVVKVAETKPIPFDSTSEDDSSLAKGQTSVKQKGVDGTKAFYYEVTYKDGKQTSKKLVSESVTKKPITQITKQGTYVAPAASPSPTTQSSTNPAPAPAPSAYYANCTAARAAGVTPIYRGQPGYRSALDRDGDGVACE